MTEDIHVLFLAAHKVFLKSCAPSTALWPGKTRCPSPSPAGTCSSRRRGTPRLETRFPGVVFLSLCAAWIHGELYTSSPPAAPPRPRRPPTATTTGTTSSPLVGDQSDLCAGAILDIVDASNICKAACALRMFKDDPEVSGAWKDLMLKLASNPSMQEVVLLTVPSTRD